jgi:DNA-binding LacI/PurR family transcriptional regulator
VKQDHERRYASSVEVARLAGVSQSAVSRTFTPGSSVSAKTRAKVLEAAAELDYRPSIIPQIMLGGRSRLIAVVLGGLGNPYYAEVLQELAQQLEARGRKMLVLYVESDYALDSVVAQLASYRVDAVISALAVLSKEVAEELSAFKIPIIAFNTNIKTRWISSVSANNRNGGAQIARLFLERGAKRPAFLSGPLDSPCSRHRLAGFRQELRRHGVQDVPVLESTHFSYDGGYAIVESGFRGKRIPDALFCANDLLAMGAMDALRHKLGLRVPQDVMVAGFDGIPESGWEAFDLTTIPQPPPLLVRGALQLMDEMLTNPGHLHPPVTVQGLLIERKSTRRT